MKKIILSLVLVAVLLLNVFALVACNKNKGGDQGVAWNPSEGGTYSGEYVEITFYHTMGQKLTPSLEAAIAAFNEIYPNIKIIHSQEGGYDDVRDKISTELTVGDQPNIAYCYPDHVALYNMSGAVVALDDLINNTETQSGNNGHTEQVGLTQAQIDDFIDGYYNEGKSFGDGKMYTLPLSKSTEVLYYNKDVFAKHGLSVPTTWDELEQVCKKLKELYPDCTPLGYDSEANWFITMTEQLGTPYTSATGDSHFLFDTAENHAFVKKFTEWYTKGYVTTQEIYGAYTSGLFKEQKSFMSIGSSAGATNQRPSKGDDGSYPFDVGIATIPQANPSNPKVISQGPSLCIFNGTKDEVLASWLFVKFLTTNVDFQAAFSIASGYVPVIESVMDNETFATHLASADGGDNIAALSAKVCMDQQSAYYTSPAFNGSSVARDQVGTLIQTAFINCELSGDPSKYDGIIEQAFKDAIGMCEYLAG